MTKKQKYYADYMPYIIGQNIERLLKQSGKSRAWLAEELERCDKTVDRYINGGITMEGFVRVAVALGVEPAALLVDHEEGSSDFPAMPPADFSSHSKTKDRDPLDHGPFLRCLISSLRSAAASVPRG